MKKSLIRPAMIVVPLVLGMFIPQASCLGFLVDPLLMAMLFMVYLQLNVKELKPRAAHWTILGANIAVGVTAYLLFGLTGDTDLAQAAFFIGITPTATAAPVIMNLLRGRVGFVVSGFVVTNIGISLALVPLIPAVTGQLEFDFMLRVLRSLVLIMALPLVFALALRRVCPAAETWPKRFKMLSLSMWSVMLFIISARAADFLREHDDVSPWIVVGIAGIAALLCAVNFTLGHFIVPRRLRREGSQTLGQKNTMLTLSLASAFASPLAALGPTFYVICHNFWNSCQLFMFDRRDARREERRRRKAGDQSALQG